MKRIPKRASLVAQVADILRQELRKGKWRGALPSENSLCDQLKVSRNTLRSALTMLQRDGLIGGGRGRRRQITGRAAAMPKHTKTQTVALLSGTPLQALSAPTIYYHLSELRRHLYEAGYELQVHAHGLFHHPRPGTVLDRKLRETNAACWILVGANAPMQRWFAGRGVPVIAWGACHEGIRLPSFGLHFRALCRHAVGMFLRHGHRRIAFVTPRTGFPSELNSESGFREGFEDQHHTDAEPRIVHHDATVEGVQNALRTLIAGPNRPTGLLVAGSRHVLTAMSHLQHDGMRLPEDVSLIARDSDWVVEAMVPSVARYAYSHELYVRRLARLVIQLATTSMLPLRQNWLMPSFQKGDTLETV